MCVANVKGGVFGSLGLVLARIVIVFFRQKTDKEKKRGKKIKREI